MTVSTTRRGFVVAATGTVLATSGCLLASGGSANSPVDEHANQLSVLLEGDGQAHPVDVEVLAGTSELSRTVQYGEALMVGSGDSAESVEVEFDYEDDGIDMDVEWRVDDVSVDVEIEQDVWQRTVFEVGVTIEDGQISFAAEVALDLPDSTTELTVTDERPVDEWEYSLELDVEDDAEETELEVEIERDD